MDHAPHVCPSMNSPDLPFIFIQRTNTWREVPCFLLKISQWGTWIKLICLVWWGILGLSAPIQDSSKNLGVQLGSGSIFFSNIQDCSLKRGIKLHWKCCWCKLFGALKWALLFAWNWNTLKWVSFVFMELRYIRIYCQMIPFICTKFKATRTNWVKWVCLLARNWNK